MILVFLLVLLLAYLGAFLGAEHRKDMRVRSAWWIAAIALAAASAGVVRRLGRLTGVRPVPDGGVRAPVPDWLGEALVGRAGRDRVAVAAMDAATAFDEWTRFLEQAPR